MVTLIEESDLFVQYAATRSPEIREQLVLQGVPLVHYMLGRLGISREIGLDYEDLVHQGLLGLIDAVDRYDPQHGTRFSTYASIRIRGKIIDYLRSCDWMSRGARQRVRSVQNGIADFWMNNHREPTDDELAKSLEMDVNDVQQALSDSVRNLVSLDSMGERTDEDDTNFYDTLVDDKQENPSDIFQEADQKQKLIEAIRKLPEREQLVLSLYYFEELTFKEIGKVLEVSESRAYQLHSRAILNIKALIKDE